MPACGARVVQILLILIDGTIRLLSKLCFYCLLLSILWLSEPYLYPSEAAPITPAAGKKDSASPAAGPPGGGGGSATPWRTLFGAMPARRQTAFA